MISQKSPQPQPNVFTTPPSKKIISPKTIMRKPSFGSFTKKKPSEIAQIRSSDRIRFISPTKANLYITEEMIDPQNSIEFNYTQYSSNQQINYPFIRKCTSPKRFDHLSISRKSSLYQDSINQDNSFLSTFHEPSIQYFSNCQFDTSAFKNDSDQLQQQIQSLQKTNFQLNLLLGQKNELIEKQKLEYDARLIELSQELTEIKTQIQKSEDKIIQTDQKILNYQSKVKELQQKLVETNEKLDKAEKQVKMFKAKFRTNFKDPKLTQELKSKKFHQNCCKGHQNHVKSTKNNDLNSKCLNKQNTLKQSKKTNLQTPQGISLKKMKSQTILPLCDHSSLQVSSQTTKLMKIHSNEEEFNEYISMRLQIENLAKQIRYKDIQILTLKKIKCQYDKEKENFDKAKKFNKKLLTRVQFLTNEVEISKSTQKNKRLSLPVEVTPKKKFQFQYEEFEEDSNQDQNDVSEFVEFELSPEKIHTERHNIGVGDVVFQVKE